MKPNICNKHFKYGISGHKLHAFLIKEKKFKILSFKIVPHDHFIFIQSKLFIARRFIDCIQPSKITNFFSIHWTTMYVYRTNWLWRTGFGVHRQFPAAMDERRRSLLPGMRQYCEEGANVDLVRDRLYINGKLCPMIPIRTSAPWSP